MESFEEIHRYFLRTILSKGVLTEYEAEKVVHSFPDGEHYSVKDLIALINIAIRPMKQTIKNVTNEITSIKEVVFLNLVEDEASLAQTVFSQEDLDYFHLLLQEILTAERKVISGIAAVNLSAKAKKTHLTKTHAQDLLDTWCRLRYLQKKSNELYALDTRTIHEFEPYFKRYFPDFIDSCTLCDKSIFHGKQCPSCGKMFHIYCLEVYLCKISKWPCCKINYVEMEENDLMQSELEVTNIAGDSSSSSE